MKPRILLPLVVFILAALGACANAPTGELARWEDRAARVEIIRDDWGIPHIYAPTDADAVFGLMYAQAEDDFPRIERNFLVSQGRLAEAEGESALWQDLRMQLFIDPAEMRALYAESPEWLRQLMDAWADGLNYYLHTHPETEPLVLDRFEPWMALTFSEGSIGGDIERVNLRELEVFYTNPQQVAQATPGTEPRLAAATDAAEQSLSAGLVVDDDTRPTTYLRTAPQPTRTALVRTAEVHGEAVRREMSVDGAMQSETAPAAKAAATPPRAAHPVAYDNNRRAQPSASGASAAAAGTPTTYASALVTPDPELEPTGSNGIAIAPENTANGNALLLINPHTSFYFRHEAHVVSDEGLNAYGALTWGQFFIYQGFNETAGWMHTSSSVDNIDEFLETVVEREDGLYYVYGDEERPVETRAVTVRYRTPDDAGASGISAGDRAGNLAERTFTVYRTHHGPIVRAVDGRWVSVALMEEPLRALVQSYARTKAANLDEYLAVMETHTNSSNNTLFADAEGNVAYLHSNFVPVRDDRFDYSRPVDGSDPATDWQGVHTLEESPNAINPATGFAFCTNNWPYSAAGAATVKAADYPSYMDSGTENPRGIHALMLLEDRTDFTLEGLRAAAYDSYLPAFEALVPALVRGWDALPAANPLKQATTEQVRLLRGWDLRWSVESVPTSLAVFWGEELLRRVQRDARAAGADLYEYAATRTTAAQRLEALVVASDRLVEDFGDWRTPWGEINRFQRLSGEIDLQFDDDAPSIPVGFTSARWGSLASFGAAPREGASGTTRKWYGTSGNSFVAVVEFGERVRAVAVTAGGLNNVPGSAHFADQAERYADGDLRPVHFYREDVEAAAQRTYRPGGR